MMISQSPLGLQTADPADAACSSRIAQWAYQPNISLMGQAPVPMGADYAAGIAFYTRFVDEAES